jgi:hypothetical protein
LRKVLGDVGGHCRVGQNSVVGNPSAAWSFKFEEPCFPSKACVLLFFLNMCDWNVGRDTSLKTTIQWSYCPCIKQRQHTMRLISALVL